MKTLVIAEKPSVARDIARVLGCKQKGEGCLQSDAYIVSWAIGHLATLMEPEDYNPAHKKWTAGSLPIIPENFKCKPIYKTRAQLTVLKKLMNAKEVDGLVCATDSGREGELIFRYIYQLASCKKPFKRLWISSLTDTAIKNGFEKLKDGGEYDALFTSARCRAEADWLVGINATRAYTVRYGTLLSVGRVQTPTLAILVARQKEINAFTPTDYWEVKATFEANGKGSYEGTYKSKLTNAEEAKSIALKVNGKPGQITDLKKENKKLLPPLLFDLTELQRECNRRLSFSAQKTLSVAQSLYEKHKLITYPRTDSRYISKDMIPKLPQVVKALSGAEAYKEAAAYLLSLPSLPVSGRIADDGKVTDHHAIIPTGKAVPASLSPDERAVFDRIARNFLAAFYPAHIYEATSVVTAVEGEEFVSNGSVVIDEGWKFLYRADRNSGDGETGRAGRSNADGETGRADRRRSNQQGSDTDANGPPLPPLTKGERVITQNAESVKKQTQPPKTYTEASLLSAMEHAGRFVDDEALKEELKESGLGTPATRAAIIERLIAVGYVERKKKSLIPTEKGIGLIEVVPAELRSPETTGKWERGLSRIAKGNMDSLRFMESIKRYVRYIVGEASGPNAPRVEFKKEPPRRTAPTVHKKTPK